MTAEGDSEQFVGLEVDITNLHPIEYMPPVIYKQLEYVFSTNQLERLPNSDFAVIYINAKIDWRKGYNKENFERSYATHSLLPTPVAFKRLSEMAQYKRDIEKGDVFAPPILIKKGDMLIQADGARRIISHRWADKEWVDVIIVIKRKDIYTLLEDDFIKEIADLHREKKWFNAYQEIIELNLTGARKRDARFPKMIDLSIAKDQTIVDFGCNCGFTLFEGHYSGVKTCIGFDYISKNIDIINRLARRLCINVEGIQIDFNDPNYQEKILQHKSGWDYSLFLSVYRTRELKDPKGLFRFIWEHSKKGMFFEGHSDKTDTDAYYQEIFQQLDNCKINFLGTATDFGHHPRRNYLLSRI